MAFQRVGTSLSFSDPEKGLVFRCERVSLDEIYYYTLCTISGNACLNFHGSEKQEDDDVKILLSIPNRLQFTLGDKNFSREQLQDILIEAVSAYGSIYTLEGGAYRQRRFAVDVYFSQN